MPILYPLEERSGLRGSEEQKIEGEHFLELNIDLFG